MDVSFGRGIRFLMVGVSGAVLMTLSLTGPAVAREQVDPSTLNPAPPAEFNPVCFRSGSNIICDVAFSDPEVVDEPSGIVCDGTELLFSQSRSVVGKRYYDADGNLLTRHFREYFDGTYTNPATGLVALWTQHDTQIHNLAVPGDIESGVSSSSGSIRVWTPGGGTILTDTGVVVGDAEGILHQSAHHPFFDYFEGGDTAALAPLCDALD